MKENIIFICQRVPYPPDRGDRIATFNIIKHLSKRYSIHLFCLTKDKKDFEKKKKLRKFCDSVNIYEQRTYSVLFRVMISILFSKEPLSNTYYYSKKMERDVKEAINENKIKIAYTYSSNVYQYISKIKNIKKVFHLADVDSEKWKKLSMAGNKLLRPIYKMEANRLREWEIKSAKEAHCSILCTEEEKRLFTFVGGGGRVEVVRNGVDTDYFKGFLDIEKERAIIFTGVMDYYPNIDAVMLICNEVIPLIKKEIPDIKFYIVGSNPTRKIRSLEKKLNNCIVTGHVKDVRPYLSKSMLSVIPMRIAQGIQNKVLEALAMKLPVVTNSQTIRSLSFSGLTEGLVEANTPDEIADSIIKLFNNPEECHTLGENGRRAVIENYSWDKNLEKLDKILEEIRG